MTAKRFTIEKSSIVEDGFFICDNTGKFSFPTTKDKSDLIMYEKQLNELAEENRQLKQEVKSLREHFIYLIETALEDKECRKIYAKGLLEIFDDCANLDEAKIKIKEYLE